jgi:hypothetical protein
VSERRSANFAMASLIIIVRENGEWRATRDV